MAMTTRKPARQSVNSTSSTALRIDTDRSFRMTMSTPLSSSAWIAGNIALTRSTTSTVLASGWR